MRMKKDMYVLLHNIRSTHNVGSIFRTSDALRITKLILSGYTPTPIDRFGKSRRDIAKVALGAEKTIPWEYKDNPVRFIKELKKKGVSVVGLEQSEKSVDYKKVKVKNPTLFIIGNEVEGIDTNILNLCDVIAEIPMKGNKESLNVSVAYGIGLARMLGL